jgi:O-antigen/teichoic acid export membrane protein
LARNGALSFLSQAGSAVLVLVAVALLARALGKEAFGEFSIYLTVLLIVQLVAESAIATVLTARVIRAGQAWKEMAAEAAGLVVVSGLLVVALLLGTGGGWAVWRDDTSFLVRLAPIAVACLGMLAQMLSAGIFRAFDRFGFESLARVLQGAVFAGLVAVYVRRSEAYALEVALWSMAASHVLAGVVMLACLQRTAHGLGLRFRPRAMWGWLVEAVPLVLGDFVRRLTLQIDTVLLTLLQGPVAVGIYRLACLPMVGLSMLPRVVLLVTFPSFVRLAAGSREVMAGAFARCTRLLWVICLPLAVLVCVLAEPIAVLLGGPEFVDAAVPMRILVWILALTFLSTQFRFVFTALGQQRLYVLLVTGVFMAETAFEAVLTPTWSYLGLCTGFLLGEMLFVVVGFALCRRLGLVGVQWGLLVRASLGAAAMGAVVWLARDWPLPLLLAMIVLTTGCYFVYCYLSGAILAEEGKRVGAAFRRLVGPRPATPAPATGEDFPARPRQGQYAGSEGLHTEFADRTGVLGAGDE